MNKTLKYMIYSLALSSLLYASSSMASNTNPVDPNAAPSVPVAPVNNVEPVVAPAAPANLAISAADLAQITAFIGAVKGFNTELQANKGNETAIMNAIFQQGGFGQDVAGMFQLLADKVNILVQEVKTQPGGKGAKCQLGCKKLTYDIDGAVSQFQTLLPLVNKYNALIVQMTAQHESLPQMAQDLVTAGIEADLHTVIAFTQQYAAYVKTQPAPAAVPAAAPLAAAAKNKQPRTYLGVTTVNK